MPAPPRQQRDGPSPQLSGEPLKHVRFDYSQLCEDAIGARGLSATDLENTGARAEAAVIQLRDFGRDPETRFVNVPEIDLDPILAYREQVEGLFDDLIVLGIGGSSLGARAIYDALFRARSGKRRDGSPRDGLRIHVVENVDAGTLLDVLDSVDLTRTLVNVVTKSGNTIETMSAFAIVRARLVDAVGETAAKNHVVATTDPLRGALRQIVKEEGLQSFDVPPGVGGRFSVFTAVGLLPLALAGVDVVALMAGARAARDHAYELAAEDNAAAMFAATQVTLYERGQHDVVFMPYSDGLRTLADWFVQLWAESLGKETGPDSAVGPTPIAARGATDQHSQLQLFMEGPANKNMVFVEATNDGEDVVVPDMRGMSGSLAHLGGKSLRDIRQAELIGVRASFAEVGRPTSTFVVDCINEETLGSLMMTLMASTALAGFMFAIDPFNQPGVELAKRYAHGLLGRSQEAHYAEKLRATPHTDANRTIVI
ncbi:MAG: glucose-6-phosphate isomerase [Bradymonadia bacterium]|jgi:glucose-6-phosphate isomerase